MARCGRKKIKSIRPMSSSAVSLHQRFTRVLQDQLIQTSTMTYDPVVERQQSRAVVLNQLQNAACKATGSLLVLGPQRRIGRPSVWARLGRRQGTRVTRHVTGRGTARGLSGFWSFRKKYSWRVRGRLQRHRVTSTRPGAAEKPGAGTRQRGRATAYKGCVLNVQAPPTKWQLDKQLDEYMSLSKRRLDDQLDDYMSMSKSRLDADLDEYMSLAGETPFSWE